LNQEKRNRGKGISETEGKGAQGSAERVGSPASFNPISLLNHFLQLRAEHVHASISVKVATKRDACHAEALAKAGETRSAFRLER
jgi:hypothetical protein